MPWSMAWPTARLASCTSMLPYIVVLISQVPKPIVEQIRSVLPKRRCSIIFLPLFLRTNRNRKQTKRERKRLFNAGAAFRDVQELGRCGTWKKSAGGWRVAPPATLLADAVHRRWDRRLQDVDRDRSGAMDHPT